MVKILCVNVVNNIKDALKDTLDSKIFKLFINSKLSLIEFIKSIDDVTLGEIVNSLEVSNYDKCKCNENDHKNVLKLANISSFFSIAGINKDKDKLISMYTAQVYFEILSNLLKEEYKQRTIIVN